MPAKAENRQALIYALDRTQDAPLFTQQINIETSASGERLWDSKAVNSSGEIVMTEVAKMKDEKIIYHYVEQRQINEAYELTVSGDKGVYKTFKLLNGKKKEPGQGKTIEIKEDFITGPLAEFYLQKKWNELSSGKKIEVHFGVFELMKAVDFEFKKKKEVENIYQVEMKPSGFFVSMFVNSIWIEFNKLSKKMMRYKGRTALREKVQGQWKALDVEIVYQ
jgi:outer membrane protein assembly factor BamB